MSNLSDAEFKTLVIEMLKELSEKLNIIKKIQSETKDTQIEIKNNLQGNNSRMEEAKNEIKIWNIRKRKQPIRTTRRKKNPNKEKNISSLWDNFKRSNIPIIRVPEGEEKEQHIGNLFEK